MCKARPAVYSSEVFFFSLDSSEFCSTVPDFSYQCLYREPFSFPHQCSEVLHSLAGLAKGCPSLEKSRPVIRSYKTSPCFDISTAPTTDLLPGLTMPKRVVKSFFHRPRENKCTKRPSLNTQVGQRFVWDPKNQIANQRQSVLLKSEHCLMVSVWPRNKSLTSSWKLIFQSMINFYPSARDFLYVSIFAETCEVTMAMDT